jgi:hypothetical protein
MLQLKCTAELLPAKRRQLEGECGGQVTGPSYIICSLRSLNSFLIQCGLSISTLFFSYSSSCSKFVCHPLLCPSF